MSDGITEFTVNSNAVGWSAALSRLAEDAPGLAAMISIATQQLASDGEVLEEDLSLPLSELIDAIRSSSAYMVWEPSRSGSKAALMAWARQAHLTPEYGFKGEPLHDRDAIADLFRAMLDLTDPMTLATGATAAEWRLLTLAAGSDARQATRTYKLFSRIADDPGAAVRAVSAYELPNDSHADPWVNAEAVLSDIRRYIRDEAAAGHVADSFVDLAGSACHTHDLMGRGRKVAS